MFCFAYNADIMDKRREETGLTARSGAEARADVSVCENASEATISTNDVLKIAKRSFKRFDALYRKLAE